MNISTYIFGSLGNGYSQYPNDYAQTIFQSIYAQSSAPTQIVVHREDKLIYYAYVRKLEAGQYIGLCVVLNSIMLIDFNEMFSIFENQITSLVVNGVILQFNDKGDIISKASQLYTNQAEVSRITDCLRSEFAKLESTSKVLPPINYSIAKNEKRTFSIDDNVNDIIKASVSYNFTFIFKQKDYDTQSLNSYRGIVSRLNKEKLDVTQRYQDLQKEHTKVLKQKKQFQLVVTLALAILVCCVALFFLNDNLNMAKNELANANDTISIKNDTIAIKNKQISSLRRKIHNLKVDLNEEHELRLQTESSLDSMVNTLNNIQPFIVKSTSFNFYSGWLSFDYFALKDTTITIAVKAIGDNNYSNSSNINIEKGEHSNSIYLNSGLNSSKWYSFELLVGDKIIGGGRH